MRAVLGILVLVSPGFRSLLGKSVRVVSSAARGLANSDTALGAGLAPIDGLVDFFGYSAAFLSQLRRVCGLKRRSYRRRIRLLLQAFRLHGIWRRACVLRILILSQPDCGEHFTNRTKPSHSTSFGCSCTRHAHEQDRECGEPSSKTPEGRPGRRACRRLCEGAQRPLAT